MTPHQETLTLAARDLAAAWEQYVGKDGDDSREFEAVAAAIGAVSAALGGEPGHPAEATRERLRVAYETWFGQLTGSERDAIGIVRDALNRIAEDDEAKEVAR